MHEPSQSSYDRSTSKLAPPRVERLVESDFEISATTANPIDSDLDHPANLTGQVLPRLPSTKTPLKSDSKKGEAKQSERSPSKLEKFVSFAKTALSVLDRAAGLYFHPKSWERDTKIYKALGVHHFKRAIMAGAHFVTFGKAREGGLRKTKENQTGGNYYFMGQSEEGMRSYTRWSYAPEAWHLYFAATNQAPVLLHNLTSGTFDTGQFISNAALFALNMYCVMLQRYNRARVFNTLDRIEKRRNRV